MNKEEIIKMAADRTRVLADALEAADVLFDQVIEQADVNATYDGTASELSAIKAKITVDVACELNENGKPLFSNESARSAEVADRMGKNQMAQAYADSLAEQAALRGNLSAKIEKTRNYIALYKAFLHGGS